MRTRALASYRLLILEYSPRRILAVNHTPIYGTSRVARSRRVWGCCECVSLIIIRIDLKFFLQLLTNITSGAYFFLGGLLLVLGGIGEWLLGMFFIDCLPRTFDILLIPQTSPHR